MKRVSYLQSRRRLAFVSVALVMCVVGAVASLLAAPEPSQSSPQHPIFRARVEYVSLDVVVTDTNDKPITDLKREDFEIVEHGKTPRPRPSSKRRNSWTKARGTTWARSSATSTCRRWR